MSNVKGVRLTPAKFAVDLSDGSERGFYVNQDYILQKLHRPHRGINLMYCYYPLDEAWPARAQDAYADKEISFSYCLADVATKASEVVITNGFAGLRLFKTIG